MSLLDFLFPKYCVCCKTFGSYLCATCFSLVSFTETGFCVVCQKAAIGGMTHPVCRNSRTIDGVFSSLVYTGVVKKLISQFKYRPYLTQLKGTLTDFFYEGLIQKELFYSLTQEQSLLVPIPLHKLKLRKRGYNQAKLLAEGLSRKLDIPVQDLLERIKNTKTQVGLSQQERAENIRGAFALSETYVTKMKNIKNIFLVDDVATSGATLQEAAKILKKAGVGTVWGITLAHGQ
jgi:competence protein ComFC